MPVLLQHKLLCGRPGQPPLTGCLCCSAAAEDDLHIVAGCPATGSADFAQVIPRLLDIVLEKRGVSHSVPLDPLGPLLKFQLLIPQLAVGLQPKSIKAFTTSVDN